MKSIIIIICTCLLFGLNSCSQDFKKQDESKVNPENMKLAQDFASDYLTKLKNGEYYEFNNEATPTIKNLLTEENQKSAYEQIRDKFGDFQHLEYSETWMETKNSLQIFRFKSDFNNSNKKLEVRVVLDNRPKRNNDFLIPSPSTLPQLFFEKS